MMACKIESAYKTSSTKVIVRFILLEDGEYLYDEKSLKLYTCNFPHKYVGLLDLKSLKVKE